MNLHSIPPIENGLINAIIETPRESRYKFKYEPEKDLFLLNKVMPLGMVFPYDFGFIPNTRGEDGDPLDVLLILEHEVFPGCLIRCRPLGILKATQKEKGKEKARNDRLLAVSAHSFQFADLKDINDLNPEVLGKIEHFFVDYNARQERVFEPIGWAGPEEAMKVVSESSTENSGNSE